MKNIDQIIEDGQSKRGREMTEKLNHVTEKAREGHITLTTDPRLAIQFASKKEATTSAKSIGWQANDATRIEVMGFQIWTISDDHGRFLTRTGYAYARKLRGLPSEWQPPEVSQEDLARVLAS